MEGQRHISERKGGYEYLRRRYLDKKPQFQTDRDGDVRMKGAKVNLEKAKREGLCYNCGIAGHQARNCRKPKQKRQDDLRPDTKIRMLRAGRIIDHEGPDPRKPEEDTQASTGETQMFEGLTSEDFETEPSNGEDSEPTLDNGERGILKWRQELMAANLLNPRVRGYRGRHRPLGAQQHVNKTSRMPGHQPDGGCYQPRTQGATQDSEDEELADSKSPKYAEKVTQGSQLTIVEERSNRSLH